MTDETICIHHYLNSLMESFMNKLLLTLLVIFTAPPSFADESNSPIVHKKTIDETKYCYYADLEYSKGAEMKQNGKKKKCVSISDSKFEYEEKDKNNLVWIKA